MDPAEFLFPPELRATATPLRNVLVVGSCLAESLVTDFAYNEPEIAFDYLLFNNASELPDRPPKPPADYDFQYLQIPLRSILSDRIVRYGEFCSETLHAELVSNAQGMLDAMLDAGLKYASRDGLLTFVTTFIVPQRAAVRSLASGGQDFSLSRLVSALNDRIRERVAKKRNVYVTDVDEIASAFGKARICDDWWHIYAHNSAMPHNWSEGTEAPFQLNAPLPKISEFLDIREHEFYRLLWQQAVAVFRTIRQVDQVKLVIFDLDNTLWRGQIAEHYGDGAEWPSAEGWPEGLVEAVHHLRARGIIVALCSRNDAELVEKRWSRAMTRGLLSLDDFVVRKINFRPKAQNVEEIMREVGLTSKSVVFVDDNPMERDDVRSSFPGIRVIGANQFLTRRILLWSAETQTAFVTDESKAREGMVRKQIEREHEKASMPRAEFLSTLNCRVTLFRITDTQHPKFSRCFELLNKTNQFNTTGKRWTIAEIMSFLQEGGAVFAFSVEDKFVNYGLVGIVLVQGSHFEQYVLSCRILGLDIETSVVSRIMAETGNRPFTARLVETEANMVSRDIFHRCGFVADGAGLFRFEGKQRAVSAPHLTLTYEAAA